MGQRYHAERRARMEANRGHWRRRGLLAGHQGDCGWCPLCQKRSGYTPPKPYDRAKNRGAA